MLWRPLRSVRRLAALLLPLALLACDYDQPAAWVYYGDSAIGRGVPFVTRLHHCPYSDQTTGGLAVKNWGEDRALRMAEAIQGFIDNGQAVFVWMTIGTVDRTFGIRKPQAIAWDVEDRAAELLEMGAAAVFLVTYNDIDPDPSSVWKTRQTYVDLVDFDSIYGFKLVDLRDLNDVILGVDQFHYSPAEHYTRAGAVHARTWTPPCS